MFIYKDCLTGDEMISDAYPIKEVDDIIFEACCDIRYLDSAGADNGDKESEQTSNILHSFCLQQTTFDKKEYVTYVKGYIQDVKRKLQENGKDAEYIAHFAKSAKDFLNTRILPNFDGWEFYTGESMNPDGMVAILGYREDGTPYMMFWKDGLEEIIV